jgi:hypothetical protein
MADATTSVALTSFDSRPRERPRRLEMELQELNSRFATVRFCEGSVRVIARKTGKVKRSWLTDDPEYTRRQLAWLMMLEPDVLPSNIDPDACNLASETMCDIQDQAISLARREMLEHKGWASPADCDKPWDLDEDWVDEYYEHFHPIKRSLQNQIIEMHRGDCNG